MAEVPAAVAYADVWGGQAVPEKWQVFTLLAGGFLATVNQAKDDHPSKTTCNTETQAMAVDVCVAVTSVSGLGPLSCENTRRAAVNAPRHTLTL